MLLDMANNQELHQTASLEDNDHDANDATPDKIHSKGQGLPAERSLSEEQFDQVRFSPLRRKETDPYPDLDFDDDWNISGDETKSPGLFECVEEELQQRSLTMKEEYSIEWGNWKSDSLSRQPVSATASLPLMSNFRTDQPGSDLNLKPSATLNSDKTLRWKSALIRCSASHDVRQWDSDLCVPEEEDNQDDQHSLAGSKDTDLFPEWSSMRKNAEDSRSDSHGLPPTPHVHMGACFSKVFNGCPLRIHCAVTWVLPKTRDQYLILGAEEGVYTLNLNELHEDTLDKILPQRCTWLYVMNNVLMSVSGKSCQLYSHSLPALFEKHGHVQRKLSHLSLSTYRFADRIIHRKFAVSMKIPDTKGCLKCSVARNLYTDSTFLCAAVPSGLVLLLWYEPLQKFMHLKHIAVSLPDPLVIFELLVLATEELPQLCVGVRECQPKSDDPQTKKQLMFDIIELNGLPNSNSESKCVRAVQVTQLDRDTILIALEKTVKIVNLKGVPSMGLASEMEFGFPIETLVCLQDSVLAFWKHGLKGCSLHNCEITQEITDETRVFRVLGTNRDIVLQSTPTDNSLSTSNLYILTGHENSY